MYMHPILHYCQHGILSSANSIYQNDYNLNTSDILS